MPKSQSSVRIKSIQLSISLLGLMVVTTSSMAFDVDYYRTLARSYMADGEIDEALSTIASGLAEYASDPELQRLREEIESNRARKAAEATKSEKERRERDDKAMADKKLTDEKAFLPKAYCSCLATKRRAKKKIDDENAVGAVSGIVDKVVLRDAGLTITNVNKIVRFMAKDSQRLRVTLGTCAEEKTNDVDDTLSCDAYFRRHYKEVNND